MKAILYPTSSDRADSILSREQVFYSIGKAMNETQHPMPVYLCRDGTQMERFSDILRQHLFLCRHGNIRLHRLRKDLQGR